MAALVSTVVLALVALQTAPSASVSPPRAQATAQEGKMGGVREMTLALPHALRKGETAWLLVEVGATGHEQIEITTQDGRSLGTISPFGARAGHAGGTYTVPVPAEAIRDGRLALRLSVVQPGGAPRAATTEEVKSVRLLIRRFKGGS